MVQHSDMVENSRPSAIFYEENLCNRGLFQSLRTLREFLNKMLFQHQGTLDRIDAIAGRVPQHDSGNT